MSGILQDKVAVITGGASGIGKASVRAFVREGAKVVIGDIQDDLGMALAAELGPDVTYMHADVTDDAQVEALVAKAVECYGKLNIMFNNAGTSGSLAPIIDMDLEAFDKTIAEDARSAVSGHKHAARQFIAQGTGGSIITTASAASLQSGWGSISYTTAKHAVVGIIRQATEELAGKGIRCNAICPGLTATPIFARAVGLPPEQADEFADLLAVRAAELQPAGRFGRPEDIADAAVFLASDQSEWITGVALPVDGGLSAVNGSGKVWMGMALAAYAEFMAR